MSCRAMKRQRGTFPSERCQSQKAILDSRNYMTFWKGQNSEDSKEVSGHQGSQRERRMEKEGWNRGFLGQWKYSLRYNDKSMSSYIYPNPQNAQHQEWAPSSTMDLTWQWRVPVGSLIVIRVPLCWGMLAVGEAEHMRKLCTFLSNFL